MRHDNLRSRGGFLRASAIAAVLVLACGIRASSAQADPESVPATSTTIAPSSLAAPAHLLVDEIIRRLRRMGINFSPTRLPHPYDPIGEVC